MLTTEQLELYRRRLQARVKRLTGDVAQLTRESRHGTGGESSGSLSDLPFHTADLAAVEEDEDATLGLLENEEWLLAETRAALERLDHGRYGQCESCGRAIPRTRLNAVPYARHCVACARHDIPTGR